MLYHGKINPHKNRGYLSEERANCLAESERLDGLLKEKLSREDYDLMQEYLRNVDVISELDCEEKFCEGFRLCKKLLLEVQ